MTSSKDIVNEMESLNGLKNLVEIYAEVASIRMMKIRTFVLKNREFLTHIYDIFKDVLASYARKMIARQKALGQDSGKITFLAHNGKTVVVLISANTGFYGSVVQNTFREFMKYVKSHDVEVTIVGRLGLTLYMQQEPGRPYTYFGLPDYGVDTAKLAELIRHLVQYEEIRVFYGEYISVVKQDPKTYVIASGTQISSATSGPVSEYIFEPTIEKILMFFETEIFASLFDQTVREAQLAKFASRILAMDLAGENIRREIKKKKLDKLRFEHRIANKKQLNALTAAIIPR